MPGVGIYLSSVHLIQTNLYPNQSPTALQALCIGVAARSFAGTLLLPATVLKTRFESGMYKYQSMSHALRVTYASEGVRGLFSGLTPTLLRDAPYSGLYYMFYSQLKSLCPASTSAANSSRPFSTFACGLVAGLLASVVTHPFDVVKTNMQLRRSTHSNFRVALVLIYGRQGCGGFFVGLAPRLIRRSLMSALTWTVYESLMKNIRLK